MLFKKDKLNRAIIPKHIAISMLGIQKWAQMVNISLSKAYEFCFDITGDVFRKSAAMNVPILTVYLLPETDKAQFSYMLEEFVKFIEGRGFNEFLAKNKVKVTVLGKWYDLPDRFVEKMKKVMEDTKGFDLFFLNFCINYDGQEEITDACRLIAMQVKAGRLSIDAINKELVKDNLYSSYFIPPDLIIETGKSERLSGILLWDAKGSIVYFTKKYFPEFSVKEFMKAVKHYQENK